MDIPTVPGTWYTVASTTTCQITDTTTGTPLGTADAGSYSFQAQGNLTTLSDDSALYSKSNFKSAPAALMALGLLGGGASAGSPLPSGYVAAYFLQNSLGAYIDTKYAVTRETGVAVVVAPIATGGFMAIGCQSVAGNNKRFFAPRYRRDSGEPGWGWGEYFDRSRTELLYVKKIPAPYPVPENVWQTQKLNYKNNKLMELETELSGYTSAPLTELPYAPGNITMTAFVYNTPTGVDYLAELRMQKTEITSAEDIMFSAIPAIDAAGVPCMYDTVSKKPFYNSGTGSFVVGLTLTQARNLSKLPPTSGSLTISLPEGYDADPAVTAAIATATANGWNVTIQTYKPAADPAAATFTLRRIWVRQTPSAFGAYVDASGNRVAVDWCVAMSNPDGSEPDSHGYELFRSVNSAADFWQLTPYVYPDPEDFSA